MQAGVVQLVQRTEDQLRGEGITGVAAEVLVVVGHVRPFLGTGDLLGEGARGEPEPVLGPLGVHAQVAGRSEGGADHRTLHELEVPGGGVTLDGEILLEVTDLEFQMRNTGITDDGVLEFHQTVRQVHVELTVPVLVDLALHGETGTADAGAVADGVGPLRSAEEDGAIDLGTDVEPQLVLGGRGSKDQNTVLGFHIQPVGLDGHAVLVVLDRLLRESRLRQKQQGSHQIK